MRKAKVRKSQVHARWNIEVKQPAYDGWPGLEAIAWADTHAEAMLLAQLLADPERYIRQAKRSAWDNGHSWGWDDAKSKAWAERGVNIGSRADWRLLTPNPHEQGEA